MTAKSDIDIAGDAKMKSIMDIGNRVGIPHEDLIPNGQIDGLF